MVSRDGIAAIGGPAVGRRQLVAGGFAATIGSFALAQQAAASQGPVGEAATGGPGLSVIGVGEASAPAESGVVQFIVRSGAGFFPPGKEAEPPAIASPAAVGDDALAALVDALTGAGVPAEAIETISFPAGPFGGPFGPGTALLLVSLEGELLDQIPVFVDAASQAAVEQGLAFDQVGVGFSVADCAALEQQALTDAAAKGKEQADGLATALGVTLGNLVAAGRVPAYGYYGGPAASACEALPTAELARTSYLPPFNPTQEPEVEIYVQLNLTYAFA